MYIFLKVLFDNVGSHIVVAFVNVTYFVICNLVCFISVNSLGFKLLLSLVTVFFSLFFFCNSFVALNGLSYADMMLRNYSLTKPVASHSARL